MQKNEHIKAKLRLNPLKNVSLLKMLTSFQQVMATHLVEQEDQWGVLLLLPASAYAYDHRVYPEADYIVFMDYSSAAVFPALLQLLPKQAKLVFKLQDEAYSHALSPFFTLQKIRGFYSYSTLPGQMFPCDEEAVLHEEADDRLIPLWAANHYSVEEVAQYFRGGAFSVSVFQDELPVSTCLAFRNEDEIWEIGAVYTLNSALRQGYAQKAVRTAIHHVLLKGYVPRYHVLESNHASIRLAESIGLSPCVKLEHWINYTQQ